MTGAEFARRLCFFARVMSMWAGEQLRAPNEPVCKKAMDRFLAECRDRLHRIETWDQTDPDDRA